MAGATWARGEAEPGSLPNWRAGTLPRLADPERIPSSRKLRLLHPRSRPRALSLRKEATEETQASAAAAAPGLSHKQSLLQTPTPRKEAGRKWSC